MNKPSNFKYIFFIKIVNSDEVSNIIDEITGCIINNTLFVDGL